MNQRMTDRVPREQRAFTSPGPVDPAELMRQLRLTETLNHDLERRKGELYENLVEHAPAAAAALTVIPSWPSRYNVIAGAISLLHTPAPTPEDLELIHNANALYQNYWAEVKRERERRDWTKQLSKIKKRYKAGEITARAASELATQLAATARQGEAKHRADTSLTLTKEDLAIEDFKSKPRKKPKA